MSETEQILPHKFTDFRVIANEIEIEQNENKFIYSKWRDPISIFFDEINLSTQNTFVI